MLKLESKSNTKSGRISVIPFWLIDFLWQIMKTKIPASINMAFLDPGRNIFVLLLCIWPQDNQRFSAEWSHDRQKSNWTEVSHPLVPKRSRFGLSWSGRWCLIYQNGNKMAISGTIWQTTFQRRPKNCQLCNMVLFVKYYLLFIIVCLYIICYHKKIQ